MLLSSRVGSTLMVCLFAAGLLSCAGGCATFGRRGPSSEKVAACRDLSRQGVTAMEAGQWHEAETLLRQALRASPEDAVAHRYLAEVLWQRGAASEALSHVADAARFDPNDARLAVRAGEMLLEAGKRDAALAHAEEAIRLDPQLAGAWALRGRVFWQLQQGERALADLQRALELAPDRSDVLLDVAAIYRQRGQPARCLTTLQHLHDACPAGGMPQLALVLQGQALLDLGRPQPAAEIFVAASERDPPNADVLYCLAQARLAEGHYAEAAAAARQALAVDASHPGSRQLLAQLAARIAPDEAQRQ